MGVTLETSQLTTSTFQKEAAKESPFHFRMNQGQRMEVHEQNFDSNVYDIREVSKGSIKYFDAFKVIASVDEILECDQSVTKKTFQWYFLKHCISYYLSTQTVMSTTQIRTKTF